MDATTNILQSVAIIVLALAFVMHMKAHTGGRR